MLVVMWDISPDVLSRPQEAKMIEMSRMAANATMGLVRLKVVADLRISDNSAERSRSHCNFGILYCHTAKDDFLVGKNPFEDCIVFPESEKENTFQLPPGGSPDANSSDDDDSRTCTPLIKRRQPAVDN
jgi:hypothetical protein